MKWNIFINGFFKNKIQNAFGSLFDTLSIERKLTNDQIEYMDFGICDYAPRQVE